MTVSLIGSHLAQSKEAANNESYWNELIKHIRTNKLEGCTLKGSPVHNLEEEDKRLYQFFSIFFEDVNVSVEALSTIWGMSEIKAQLKGDSFVRKNLLVRKYDGAIKKYVYGIHDLYLKYLRSIQKDTKALHKDLLEKYKEKCNGDFSKLPRDNYIYRYIGHHLMNAGLDEEFPKLFQSLEFLEAKLRAVGPSDLLKDFAKYEHLIKDPHRNYEWLVERIGQSVYSETDIDIVQAIFQEVPFDHPVYKKAQELAAKRQKLNNTKYIKFLNEVGKRRNVTSEVMKLEKKVTAISATVNSDYVLVGFEDGEIAILDIRNKETLEVFQEQKGAITCIRIHHKGEKWLSISSEQSVFIRSFNEAPIEIPNESKDNILWADFGIREDMVALIQAVGNQCSVVIYDGKGRLLHREENVELVWNNDEHFVAQCAFCFDDQRLVVGIHKTLIVYDVCRRGDKILNDKKTYPLENDLIALCVNPDVPHEFGILFQDSLSMRRFGGSARENANNIDVPKNFEEKFTCCAVISDIYVGTSRSSISVYDWKTGFYQYQLSRRLQPVAMSAWKEKPGTLWILDNTNNIWKWVISEADISLSCSSDFSWTWPPDSDLPLIASISSDEGKFLNVIKDHCLLMRIPSPSSNGVFHLCEDGECVAYLDNFLSVRLKTTSGRALVTVLNKATAHFLRVFKAEDKYIVVTTAKNGQSLPLKIFTTTGPLSDLSAFTCSEFTYSSPVFEVFYLKNNLVVVHADKQISVVNHKGVREKHFLWEYGTHGRLLSVTSNKKDSICLLMENLVGLCHVNKGVLWVEDFTPIATCCSFSTGGSKLVIGFKDGSFGYIDVKEGKLKKKNIITIPNSKERLVNISMTKLGEICALTPTRMYLVTNGGSVLPARIDRAKNIAVSSHSSVFSTVDSKGLMHVFKIYDDK